MKSFPDLQTVQILLLLEVAVLYLHYKVWVLYIYRLLSYMCSLSSYYCRIALLDIVNMRITTTSGPTCRHVGLTGRVGVRTFYLGYIFESCISGRNIVIFEIDLIH